MRGSIFGFLIFIFYASNTFGQGERLLVWESGAFVTYQPFKSWKFNSSIVQRTSTFSSPEGNTNEFSYLEINQMVSRKLNPWISTALGYKFRSNDPVDELSSFEHRITEQLGWVHLERRARLVSRLRVEQRIADDSFAQRQRYRISIDMPLSGEKLDPKEFYLVFSNEILYQIEWSDRNSWSDRIGGTLGYLLSQSLRLEVNFIHRIEDFNFAPEGTPFIHTNLLIKL